MNFYNTEEVEFGFSAFDINESGSEPLKECYKSIQKVKSLIKFHFKKNKSEEEIKKLTLPENLDEKQKVIIILTKGQNIQKYAVKKI